MSSTLRRQDGNRKLSTIGPARPTEPAMPRYFTETTAPARATVHAVPRDFAGIVGLTGRQFPQRFPQQQSSRKVYPPMQVRKGMGRKTMRRKGRKVTRRSRGRVTTF